MVNQISVDELARRYFVSLAMISHDADEAWLQSYRNLTFDQMDMFNELVAQYALELAEDKEENAVAKVELAKKMRTEINQKAMEVHGVPINQLETGSTNEIVESVWRSGYSQTAVETFSPSGCICVRFPYTTVPGGPAWWTNSSGRRRRAAYPGCNDCDLEVLFPRGKSVIKYVSGAGLTYYTIQSGRFNYRYTTANTGLVLGYGAVTWIFLGIEWLAQIAYRMD